MGGGLMQLVAYGAQDIYLTGNPQITFFKVVYRRHTNFSMEAIKQTFSGTAGFGKEVSATISRNGDLVYRMYLEHNCTFTNSSPGLNNDVGLVEHYGHSLIKECEIEIGGQKIDKHTSMWNRVWSDLTEPNPSGHFGGSVSDDGVSADNDDVTGTLYQLMTGNHTGFNSQVHHDDNVFGIKTSGRPINGFTYTTGAGSTGGQIETGNIFLPLHFWFCRNPGLALPLIALQYHEVKVKMNFEELNNLARTCTGGVFQASSIEPNPIGTGLDLNTPTPTFSLWCDYIYLDTDERRRFAQVSHEYLIEQLQYSENTISNKNPSINLNFNHPIKELVWTMRNETVSTDKGGRHHPLNPSFPAGDFTSSKVSIDRMGGFWQLKLNGHDRFKERDSRYFTRTQILQHHTGYGGVPVQGDNETDLGATQTARVGMDSIAVYSFALKPEEHQPSGTCNFSRIDNAQLVGIDLNTDANGNTLKDIGHAQANNVKLTIFAVNYNVLRIMSGMGGLAYSN